MKKLLLLCLFSSFSLFKANAQLTIGQVYNFDVGDEFETESCGDGCYTAPPTYRLTIVLKKTVSVTGDTIYYLDSNVSYTPPACPPPCVGSISKDTGTIMITNLDSTASQYAYLHNCPCSSLTDTLYVDSNQYCGRKVWLRYPTDSCVQSCFEPASQSSYLIEGCGGPYGDGGDFTVPISWSYDLIYYKKGPDSCGRDMILSGINEIKAQQTQVQVYPNPNKGAFTLQLSVVSGQWTGKNTIDVYNMLGEKIYTASLNPSKGGTSLMTLDMSGQPAGIYFYRVIDTNGKALAEGKVIIQH